MESLVVAYCPWCQYQGRDLIEAETCPKCHQLFDATFYEDVHGFADLFRKE